MPRGGARPGAGRKPKAKPAAKAEPRAFAPDGVKSAEAPADWPFGSSPGVAGELEVISERYDPNLTPLEYLLRVVRDPLADQRARIQCAALAAPFCHAKKGEGGKKDARQEAAEKVASRFSASAPPKLVAAGGRKV